MKKIIICVFIFMFFVDVANAETVVFNTKTKKVHSVWCKWAKQCTVNCIKIEKKEAYRRGGVPCKVCGGGR